MGVKTRWRQEDRLDDELNSNRRSSTRSIETAKYFVALLSSICLTPMFLYGHVPERSIEPNTQHGGVAKRAGDYNIEFVASDSCAVLFVQSKSNVPQSTTGADASISFYADGRRQEIELKPDGGNRLQACGVVDFDLMKTMVIDLRMRGKQPIPVFLKLR